MSGTLYLCATPIGNMEDITVRVLRLLKTCDLIAAEDTRHTLKLLNHYNIKTPLLSYHEHNKASKGHYIIEKLKEGLNIALVSDAGMPAISDPGRDLAVLCHNENIEVTVAPGASAGITALVLSGFENRRFAFEGFLPSDKKERKLVLENIKNETRTIIFYEAPHHIISCLNDLYNSLGDRKAACIREITKKFEEVRQGTIFELLSYYTENQPKGEFVIIVEGLSLYDILENKKDQWKNISIDEHMDIYIKKGMNQKDAMKSVAKDRGVSKREIYSFLLENK